MGFPLPKDYKPVALQMSKRHLHKRQAVGACGGSVCDSGQTPGGARRRHLENFLEREKNQ